MCYKMLDLIGLTRPCVSKIKSMVPQMVTYGLFTSRVGFQSFIDCILDHATFSGTLLPTKIVPVQVSHTDVNRAVDLFSNTMFA